MVGGLVQENDVRLAEQGLGQQDFDFFLSSEATHFAVQDVPRQPQTL